MASNFRNAVHMLKSNWRELGRPTLTLTVYRQFLGKTSTDYPNNIKIAFFFE